MMRKRIGVVCLTAFMLLQGCVPAAADSTVTQLSARDLILNRYTDVLGFRGKDSNLYGLIDAEGNPVTEAKYSYLSTVSQMPYFKVEVPDSADGIHNNGLIDDQGNTIIPPEYADISVISDRWSVGIMLTPSGADEKDYTYADLSSGDKSFYRIDTVDFYFRGEKVGTLSRSEYDGSVTAHGDYICVADRKKARHFYNSSFEESPVAAESSSEYETKYKNGKTFYTHNGSGEAAFTEGCPLTPEEVDSAFIYREGAVYDLQGTEVFKTAQNYDSMRDFTGGYAVVSMNGLKGLIDQEGNEVIPVEYDELGYYGAQPFQNGYISAVKDGKFGFLDENAQVSCDFVYSKDAVRDYSPFAKIQNLDGSVIVLSAAVGELPEHYKEVTFPASSGSVCFIGQNDANEYSLVDLYGNTIIPYSDNYIDVNAAGTVATVRTDYGEYEIHRLDPAAGNPDSAAETAEDESGSWTCVNGHEGNTGNFCSECGAPRPAVCPSCGYEFEGEKPNFCPNCGADLSE